MLVKDIDANRRARRVWAKIAPLLQSPVLVK